MNCTITPISAFASTDGNSKIKGFVDVANRITRQLGAPIIDIELHQDQIMEFISQSTELFTKYAGFSKEYVILNSDVYEKGKGLRMDHLLTLATLNSEVPFSIEREVTHDVIGSDVSFYEEYLKEDTFVVLNDIDMTKFTDNRELLPYGNVMKRGQLVRRQTIDLMLSRTSNPTEFEKNFQESRKKNLCINQLNGEGHKINTMYDYDLMDYRKVTAVVEWEQGHTHRGVNTLFSLEQTLQQQTYYSHFLGRNGFDLTTYYISQEFLETREKVLATKRDIHFNKDTQYLRMYPEPRHNEHFYGILTCYVEKPLRHILDETWVHQYALALSKIALGHIRGKYTGAQLFGGASLNASDLMSQGIAEKERLEDLLMKGATSGFGDANPINFYLG